MERCVYKPRSTTNGWRPPEVQGEARSRFSLRASGRNQPCSHLVSGVRPADLQEDTLLSF